MTIVKKRIEELKAQKGLRESGKFFYIPFKYHFPRLSEYVPGLLKGQLVKILAPTGAGKSKYARFLSVIMPFQLYKKYGIKYKTIFFSLEESKEDFIDNMIVALLKMRHDISTDILEINSYKNNPIDNFLFNKIEEVSSEVEEILEHVIIIDTVNHPTGIFQEVKKYVDSAGKHIYKERDESDKFEGSTDKVYSHYEANDDEVIVLVVVDHVGLIKSEYDKVLGKKLTVHEAIAKWSTTYCVEVICKLWKCCVINVQQVGMSSDDVTHFKAGKLEPTLSDGANNKEIIRDDHLVLSLYEPQRHELSEHNGYDLRILKDNYRSTTVLKNRKGKNNLKLGLYFDGATGLFKELPKK